MDEFIAENNAPENKAADINNSVKSQKDNIIKNRPTAYIVKIAMLAALAYALSFLEFWILPAVDFLKMDFTSIPVLIGGFVLGPVAALIIVVVKVALILPRSPTLYIGELSNLICSLAFALPCTILYKFKKGKKWVIIGLAISIFIEILISLISNYILIVPLFVKFFPFLKDILQSPAYYGYLSLFNLIKYLSQSVIVFFIYKRISGIMHRL